MLMQRSVIGTIVCSRQTKCARLYLPECAGILRNKNLFGTKVLIMRPEHVPILRGIIARPDYALRRMSQLQLKIDRHITDFVQRRTISADDQQQFETKQKRLYRKKLWYCDKL